MTLQTAQLKTLLAEYAKVPETEASAFVDVLVATLVEHLKAGEEVTVGGLGEFYIVESQQGKRVAFRPENKFKEAVNAPFSFFEPVVISAGTTNVDAPVEEIPVEEIPVEEAPNEENVAEPEAQEETPTEEDAPIVETQIEETPNSENEEHVDLEPIVVESEEPEPEIPELANPEPEIPEPESPKSGHKGMWAFVIVLVLLLCVGGYFVKEADFANFAYTSPEPVAAEPVVEEPVAVAPDTTVAAAVASDTTTALAIPDTAIVAVDTVLVADTPVVAQPQEPKVEKPRPSRPNDAQIMHNDDGSPLTISLGAGERLTLLAERIYGSKSFWGYIYEVNAFQLPNPNVVPCYVQLYLPDAGYYHINANDPASVARGNQKQADIFKQLKDN